MREYRRPKPVGAMALGISVTVVCLLPVFLTGAMAVQMTADLAFGSVGLGLSVAAFRSGGAVTAVFFGRLADQLGATRAMRLASLIAAVTALGIALTARGLVSLLLWLALAGSAITMAQPGANRLLMSIIDPKRLGTAFGIKQSAPPVASMLAGAAVPVIAVTVGWRWGFALAAIAAVAFALSVTSPPTKEAAAKQVKKAPREPLENRGLIVLMAVAFGLGTLTSSAATTFYVASADDAGSSPEFAGTVLAIGSLAAITARILAGIVSDRIGVGHLRMCAGLMVIGAVGFVLLASGTQGLMTFGVLVALIGSWGFNGVFWYALIRAYPTTPGRITGAVSPGGLIGSTIGPLFFGVIVDNAGYGTAWIVLGMMALIAGAAMLVGDKRLTGAA